MPDAPTFMDPAAAGAVLRGALKEPKKPITIADASVASGLAQRDAEAGLNWLTHEYRGHLRVTEDGDLVHHFPTAFEKPWETRERFAVLAERVGDALLGAGRFLVRAWLLVAMIGYALVFVALMIALTLARQGGNDRNESPGLGLVGGLFRMIGDALFWTFHPFSPMSVYGYGYYGAQPAYAARRDRRPKDGVPFYEKVNRFVFGPTKTKEDPNAQRARLLHAIRIAKGRIGLGDVMRVTGLPRTEADPLMARLMLDHDGAVEVSENGGIVYTFAELRRTAGETGPEEIPTPAWDRPPTLQPLTGNKDGANLGIAALNGFNLLASLWAIDHHLTIANIATLLTTPHPRYEPIAFPTEGLPVALGVVPLLFSVVIFALPAMRTALRSRAANKVAEERARLGVLREIVTKATQKEPVDDAALRTIVRVATGHEPSSKDITRRVVNLGGDVDVGPDGEVRYRFAELEAEAEALEEERADAPEAEARLGKVVFASDE